jgi:hypothetical protein
MKEHTQVFAGDSYSCLLPSWGVSALLEALKRQEHWLRRSLVQIPNFADGENGGLREAVGWSAGSQR